MLSPRMVGVVAVSAAICFGGATGAWAAAPNSWGPTTPFPAGTTSVGDQVLSSPTGALLRYSVQDGFPTVATFGVTGLGAATAIPGAPKNAIPAGVAWLPDGSAVMSFYRFNSGPLWFIVRFANGTFGPVFTTAPSTTESFAARAGEELLLGQTSFNGIKQITAQSLSIAANGTLTATAAPAVIYNAPGPATDPYGTQIGVPIPSLDADGQAEAVMVVDHVSASGDEILDGHRDATGAWSTFHSISGGTLNAKFAGQLAGAVAPGGRTLISFQTNDGTLTKATLYQSLREPGGTYPAPSVVNDLSGTGGAIIKTLMAAGGDGTLALADTTYVCHSTSTSEVASEAAGALIAAPGKPLGGVAVGVLDSSIDHSRLMSLGAGNGQAIVGFNDQHLTAGTPDNTCGQPALNNDEGTVADRAAIVGPNASGDHTFGVGTFAGSGNGSVVLAVDAGGIDSAGNAAVTGRLQTSGVPAYSYFEGPPIPPAGATPTPTPTPTPAPITTPPPAPVNHGSPTPTTGAPTLSSNGTVTVTVTAPQLPPGDQLGEQIALQVFSGGGATSSRVGKPKSKLIGSVKKTVKLHSKQKLVVKLKLTSKLRSYLKKHPKATVKLQLTSTLKGHTTTVTTRTVHLKRTKH
jgi:hypothetical protein